MVDGTEKLAIAFTNFQKSKEIKEISNVISKKKMVQVKSLGILANIEFYSYT